MIAAYIFGSVLIVSLMSVLAALPFLLKKKVSKRILLLLIGVSVGTLLGAVFLHFLPESLEEGYTIGLAVYVLLGFLSFFIIEKFVHYHHGHHKTEDAGHHHAYHLAPLNLAGEAVHNLIDGVVIAASYLVSIPLGVVATISVLLHELPQEIADFGILIYSGYSKKKALLFNFLAALSAFIGAGIGFGLHHVIDGFKAFILPFAAGVFLYIAASNLIPELHKERKILDSIAQILAIIAGILIMIVLSTYLPDAH